MSTHLARSERETVVAWTEGDENVRVTSTSPGQITKLRADESESFLHRRIDPPVKAGSRPSGSTPDELRGTVDRSVYVVEKVYA